MIRWAVVGSRDFPDRQLVEDVLAVRIGPQDTVLSGGARGPDCWALEWAKARDIKTLPPFLPDWNGPLKKGAGFARNTIIVENCDQVIAFWDGQSRGTADTITKAEAANKPVTVIKV